MSATRTDRLMPPPHLLQRIANNPSLEDFTRSFGFLRHIVRSYLSRAGCDFSTFNNILDFGCGVGRFLYAFEQDLEPHQKMWGCEVHEEFARWCRENIDFAEVAHNEIDPPLPFDDQQFDLVYASSVYTHLRLDMQFRWAWEIHRVLRPGGVFFLTVHGTMFFPLFHSLRQSLQLDEMYSFGDDGLFAYLMFPSQETQDQGQVHVASAHTESFFLEQFSAFEVLKRFPQSQMAGGQDLYIIRRPEHGRSIERPSNYSSDTWSFGEQVGASGSTSPVELTFQLDGHRQFRVYPSVLPAAIYWLDFRIEVLAGDHVLADQAFRFNSNRKIGGTHYGAFALDVPEHRGEVTVRLSTSLTEQGTLPSDATPEVRWCFPNFT